MPYVIRDGNNKISSVLLNKIDENTEYLDDSNDEVQFFHLWIQKMHDIKSELASRWDTLPVNGVTYSLLDPMYTNSGRASIQALIGGATDVDLPDANGNLVNLTMADANALMVILQNYINDLINNRYTLENQVKSATTLAQLQAIDVTSGWPSPP